MNISVLIRDFMNYVSGTAIVLNLILLPVAALRSGKDIGSYKYLLSLYIAIAVIHASLTFISLPIFEPSPKGWIFFATIQRLPRDIGSYFICSYSVTHIKMLMILTYSFIYRYFAVCWPNKLIWFKCNRRIWLLVIIYIAVVVSCAFPIVSYFRMNEELAQIVDVVSIGGLDLHLRSISYIGAPMFWDGKVVVNTALTLGWWTTVMLGASSIAFFCSVNIVLFFRDAGRCAQLSPANQKLQRRLFTLLALQTAIPLTFAFIPSCVGYLLAYLSIHAQTFTEISSSLLPITQLLDPIYIFFLVSEYNQFFLRLFRRHFLGSSTGPAPTSTVVPTNMSMEDLPIKANYVHIL